MQANQHSHYVGRFAPSPTGPLHFGSAVAAIASFLDARANHGKWLLRIDDLDPPREQPGASDSIITCLKALGLEWDEEIVYQSQRDRLYEYALETLRKADHLFDCACSRREVGPGPYPGTCRSGLPAGKTARSVRFRTNNEQISFTDTIFGPQLEDLRETVGDFILRRSDGLHAYHLAVVVDDAAQQVTHVVRGVDLLPSTSRQIALQDALGYPRPRYLHFPVVCDASGVKLSKQTGASGINIEEVTDIWARALRFLGQPDVTTNRNLRLDEIISLATQNWRIDPLRTKAQLP